MICHVCKTPLDQDRIEALNVLEVPESAATCLNCAPNRKKMGIYLGESGLSPLLHVDGLGDYGIQKLEHANIQEDNN